MVQVPDVTTAVFRTEFVESGRTAVVLFVADTERDARVLASYREWAADETELAVGIVDGSAQAELDAWQRIVEFPTAIAYRGGVELCRRSGAVDTRTFAELRRLLLDPAAHNRCGEWSAVDRLGSALPDFVDVGGPRGDKYVGMFYFVSYGVADAPPGGYEGPFDNTKILAADPSAIDRADSPPWGPYGAPHHWGESLHGYYHADDPYVVRKHAQMLSDVGVDFIVMDLSNVQDTDPPGAYFQNTWMTVFREFDGMAKAGFTVPKIAFLLNFWAGPHAVEHLYRDLYQPRLFEDLWFRWDGKPLMLYDKARLRPEHDGIADFFTFRRPMPDYFYGPQGADQWSWAEAHPQHGFFSSAALGEIEEVSVSIAQNVVRDESVRSRWRLGCMSTRDENGDYLARGRSFANGVQPRLTRPELSANFTEQWERALELDPRVVFVTGWNEWVMGRFDSFMSDQATNIMVDQFDTEFSRDIEPSRGPIGDNAYLALAGYIRRFKGAAEPRRCTTRASIALENGFGQWAAIEPTFDAFGLDVYPRDFAGYGGVQQYVNDSGRNIFRRAKVVRDDTFVYFYAQCCSDIVGAGEPWWLNLLIRLTDADRPSWESFHFLLGRTGVTDGRAVLEASQGGFSWSPVAEVAVAVAGSEVMLRIPLAALDLGPSNVAFDFTWCDNVPLGTDPFGLEWYTDGDTAPSGRFCYRYLEDGDEPRD